MAQSGLRPDTLYKLKVGDVEPNILGTEEVLSYKIKVVAENTKGAYSEYFTFMGQDSVNSLRAYFAASRPNITSENLLFTRVNSEQPANPKSFSGLFSRVLRQLKASGAINYKEGAYSKPSELRLYTLRKYFRNHAGQAGPEYVNFWMGHLSALGVDLHYFGKNVDEHRKRYEIFALPYLRLESHTPAEAERAVIEKTEEIDGLKSQVAELAEQVSTLQNTIKTQWRHINAQSESETPEQKAETEENIKVNTLARMIKKTLTGSGMSVEDFMKAIAEKSKHSKSGND